MIAEKLYGREGEIATLLAAFDRVVMHGGSELVLVSGYSGIGKSSVVNELPQGHRAASRHLHFGKIRSAPQGHPPLRHWLKRFRD